jgi:uncharacterized protein YecE (DUF72 family)
VVLAADSHHPQIADLTAPFVYVRAMGARTTEKFGYTDAEIDLWAARAKLWASGGAPDGLEHVDPTRDDGRPRDVYLYFISGEKRLNRAAAMALIERVG